tara:strand:+ start:3033 stop:3290 length:258 start_codon:yes stop_codon:yes gene_type:complete
MLTSPPCRLDLAVVFPNAVARRRDSRRPRIIVFVVLGGDRQRTNPLLLHVIVVVVVVIFSLSLSFVSLFEAVKGARHFWVPTFSK